MISEVPCIDVNVNLDSELKRKLKRKFTALRACHRPRRRRFREVFARFLGENGPKNFLEMIVFIAAIDSIKFSSKTELSSRFFGRWKFSGVLKFSASWLTEQREPSQPKSCATLGNLAEPRRNLAEAPPRSWACPPCIKNLSVLFSILAAKLLPLHK